MNFLVDTHAIIWFITNDSKLPKKVLIAIQNPENTCYVSIASFWELGIKISIGRLDLNTDLENIFEIILESGFELLPITPKHIL